MRLYMLSQKEYSDFTRPDFVNTMIIRAESEEKARAIANRNERKHRDGNQIWGEKDATCHMLFEDGKAGVIIVA